VPSLMIICMVPISGSEGATIYFSMSNTNPGLTPSNPQVTTAPGSPVTLYIWAQLNQNEAINGLSLSIVSNSANGIVATVSQIYQFFDGSGSEFQARWASPINSGSDGTGPNLVTDANAVFVTGNYWGLDGYEGIPSGDTSHGVNGTVVAQGIDPVSGTPLSSILVGEVDWRVGELPVFRNGCRNDFVRVRARRSGY
jgi:hypothetical protein